MTRFRINTFLVALLVSASQLLAQAPADLRKAMQERDQAVDKLDAVAWDRLTAKRSLFVALVAGGGLLILVPSLIFFVLVDGWALVAGSLVQSYGPG